VYHCGLGTPQRFLLPCRGERYKLCLTVLYEGTRAEQIERVWTLVYAEVESWTSTHTPAVVAVLSRLKSAGTGAYLGCAPRR
jgi:hypothetical protein